MFELPGGGMLQDKASNMRLSHTAPHNFIGFCSALFSIFMLNLCFDNHWQKLKGTKHDNQKKGLELASK